MSRKVKGASVLSLVATLGVILFGTDGSRAMAEESVISTMEIAGMSSQTTVSAQAAPNSAAAGESTTRFVSQPVIQALPAEQTAVEERVTDAASLADLVKSEPLPGKLDEQLQCLAGAIYFESKGEPLAGQLAVGRVIVARANSSRFPSTYCGVVYQRSQFSFVRGGHMPRIKTESRAWKRAKKLALIAHEGAWESKAEGALFFHARYVSPRWKNRLTRLAQIDNHIFYR